MVGFSFIREYLFPKHSSSAPPSPFAYTFGPCLVERADVRFAGARHQSFPELQLTEEMAFQICSLHLLRLNSHFTNSISPSRHALANHSSAGARSKATLLGMGLARGNLLAIEGCVPYPAVVVVITSPQI
jgi:hypothetical protein